MAYDNGILLPLHPEAGGPGGEESGNPVEESVTAAIFVLVGS